MAVLSEKKSKSPQEKARITLYIHEQLRRRLKIAAVRKDVPLSVYIEDILVHTVPKEDVPEEAELHPINAKAAADLLAFRDELAKKHPDVHWGNSVDMVREVRAERMSRLERSAKL